ncbi:MAG: carbohydrate kinase family protein [Gammaproteobacteria bacterium]
MTALICGSFAFDTIMVFPDQFKNHILPDKVHILNVSFLVPEMRREFGGCAGNIAYNLKLLGGEGVPMGTVGRDFDSYAQWMDRCGISRKYLRVVADSYTAQAFITTDLDDNQITAFHPGAMNSSHLNEVPTDAGIRIGIVSPDGRDGMIEHAAQFKAANIPFIFDPGQGLPMFGGAELTAFIDQASWVTVNDYECELLQERTGLTPQAIAERIDALIVTLGAKGSHIYTQNKRIEIPSAKISSAVDPTGCGDAYRAGLLYGIMNQLDWETTGRIAALMGAMKIEHPGTQNHSFTKDEFAARFKNEFGSALKM